MYDSEANREQAYELFVADVGRLLQPTDHLYEVTRPIGERLKRMSDDESALWVALGEVLTWNRRPLADSDDDIVRAWAGNNVEEETTRQLDLAFFRSYQRSSGQFSQPPGRFEFLPVDAGLILTDLRTI